MLTIFFLFFKEKGRKGKTGLLPSNHPVNAYWEIDFSLVFFFIYFEHSYLVIKIAVVIWCKSLALLNNCMKNYFINII